MTGLFVHVKMFVRIFRIAAKWSLRSSIIIPVSYTSGLLFIKMWPISELVLP
jgi:hypothetical protein